MKTKFSSLAPLLSAGLLLLAFLDPVQAANQIVSNLGDTGLASQLRQKLNACQSGTNPGGTITFGVAGTIILDPAKGPLPTITKNVTINGGTTVEISGNDAIRIFNVASGATLTLNNVTISHGKTETDDGGAVSNFGTLNVNNAQFFANATSASWSGSAILSWGPLNIVNSEFANNTGGGGAVKPRSANAVTTISGSSFHDNLSIDTAGGGYGGAMQLHDAPSVTVDKCDFENNEAGTSGGAIHVDGGSALTLTNSTISSNRADTPTGGGLDIRGSAFISNSQIVSNTAPVGGAGINAEAGAQVEIVNSTIASNKALDYTLNDPNSVDKVYGGGIRSLGALTISGSTIRDNVANVGTMTLTSSTVSANKTEGSGTGNGGGISNSGTLTLNSVTVRDNYANYNGGGISNSGSVTLNNSTVRNNTANGGDELLDQPAYGGGGIFNSNSVTLRGSTVNGNKTTKLDGGGLYNYQGVAFVGNTTFSGNTASGWGGGVISNSGKTILNHVTLTGNSAAAGGGIYNLTADSTRTIVLASTIIANSPSGYNCAQFAGSQDVQSGDYNLSDDNSFNTFCAGGFQALDLSNANAKLGPLANNGGFTLTHLPLPGSAAIDAIPSGKNGCNTMVDPDQRGIARPQGATCDMGAVEYLPLIENGSPFIQYDGWRGFTSASANGGAYRMSNVANDTVTYGFSGASIKWITLKGPSMGKALITIDGVIEGTFDLYSSSTAWNQQYVFNNLSSGSHNIVIKVTGTKNASATGFNVALDGFLDGSATKAVQESALAVQYNSWIAKTQTLASGNSYATSDTFGAATVFRFNGTSISFITARGPSYGAVDVYIDGVLKSSNVDLYSATQQWQYWLNYPGLTNTNHTIEVRPTHSKNAKSKGYSLVVDAFTGPFTALP